MVEAVEVATLQVGEAAILVGVEAREVEVVVEAAHLEGHPEVPQEDNPSEEVVTHLETKDCWAQHQKYSMEAGRTFTTSYNHSVSIGR